MANRDESPPEEGSDEMNICYKVMQVFMVTGSFAGQHNTELHGTIRDVVYANIQRQMRADRELTSMLVKDFKEELI